MNQNELEEIKEKIDLILRLIVVLNHPKIPTLLIDKFDLYKYLTDKRHKNK